MIPPPFNFIHTNNQEYETKKKPKIIYLNNQLYKITFNIPALKK